MAARDSAAGDRRVAEWLVATGRITQEQLASLITEQEARGGPERVRLGEILLERGLLGPNDATTSQRQRFEANPTPETKAAVADPAKRVGGYALLEEIGRGAMGVVHRAVDVKTNRIVAIKMLLKTSPTRLKRFEIEATAARRLRHPAIIGASDFGEHE